MSSKENIFSPFAPAVRAGMDILKYIAKQKLSSALEKRRIQRRGNVSTLERLIESALKRRK